MDTRLYDVFLTGKLADGTGREQAAERMAQLFKSAPATMLGLLSGKPQLLKRGVDRDTAQKYREALQRAGVEVAFKPQALAQPEAATPVPRAAENPAPGPVAARPAETQSVAPQSASTQSVSTPPVSTQPVATRPMAAQSMAAQSIPAQPIAAAAAAATTGSLSLAPAGADVLAPGERRSVEAAPIELGHLSLAEAGAPLDEIPRDLDAPPAPDLGHLSLQAAEGDLLSDDERATLPVSAPATDHLSLAPAGADLETLHDERPPVAVDTSQLSIAPAGSELLTPEQRRKFDEVAPETGHLRLVQ